MIVKTLFLQTKSFASKLFLDKCNSCYVLTYFILTFVLIRSLVHVYGKQHNYFTPDITALSNRHATLCTRSQVS